MNKLYYMLPLIASLIVACNGGSSGGTPPAVPTATVAGTALDGLIINGTIIAYDYTGGTKGSELGRSVTNTKGLYNLSLQSESRSVLLEVTGGYYTEEMLPNTNIILDTGDKLIDP